jgi:hypothetical protein
MTMRKLKRSHADPTGVRNRPRKEADIIDSPAVPGAGSVGATPVDPSDPASRGARTRASGNAARAGSVAPAASVQAIPSSPPAAVLEQMAQAHHIYEQLAAEGKSLHFDHDQAGRATVEMRDSNGAPLRTLSLSEALDLAAGESPE